MYKRKSVVIWIICEACSTNQVENVIYEYIKKSEPRTEACGLILMVIFHELCRLRIYTDTQLTT